MKKLLIATDSHHPRSDGIARFLVEIIRRLKSNFEITVVAPKYEGHFEEEVRTIRFNTTKFSIADFSPAKPNMKILKKLIKESDVIFTQTLGPIGIQTLRYAKKVKKPVVSFTHSIEWELLSKTVDVKERIMNILHTTTKFIAKRFYNKADRLIVPSDEIAQKLEISGIKTKLSVVNLGVNSVEFAPVKNKDAIKKELGIPKDSLVVGYTGRLAKEKDLITLYRAYKKLVMTNPNLYLLLVGDGSLKKRLIGENIIVTGFVKDVAKYLNAMDIFVLPSLTETTSLSTLEAMSCGIPVIATPVGHVRNYINNNVNGFLFPFGDIEVLTSKLQELIDDVELRKDFGDFGRKTVIDKYSWDKCADEIKSVLFEVMGENANKNNDD